MENNLLSNSYVIDDNFKYNEQKNNGRIILDETSHNGTFFVGQDCIPVDQKTNYQNATQHMLNPTVLSTTFFSSENVEIIQNAIRAGVYKMSGNKHIIDRQNHDQLKIIMKSIYLQYSKNMTHSIKQQVEELNKLVLNYSIPRVYNELVSYLKYKEDISTLPVPQDNPTYVFVDKTVELKHFF